MTRWTCRPTLEELDPRALPSATPAPTPPADLPPVHPAPPAAHHPLRGTGQGAYTQPVISVDAGTSYTLTGGTVHLDGLGDFRVSGWVRGTGMVQGGRAGGHLVLTGATGTLTVDLHGPVQGAFGPLPKELVYVVKGGTGAYAGVKGYGVAGFAFTPAPTAVGLPPQGTFNLSLS